jgi:hypothetical protein
MAEETSSLVSGHGADPLVTVTISYHSKQYELSLIANSSVEDLALKIEQDLDIPVENQKLLIPGGRLLKPPFSTDTLISSFPKPVLGDGTSKKRKPITLLAPSREELDDFHKTEALVKRRSEARDAALASARRTASTRPTSRNISGMDSLKVQEESQYTFHDIRTLNHHRKSESLVMLQRLRDDPGIKSAMRKHKFSVGLLTELEPALHTTHESKTLGLNRNKGEIIELRLLTDDRDGMRNYKDVRRTLCHELTHNVYGDHDRDFWNLCKELEKEVERNDFSSGGNRVVAGDYYEPDPESRGDHVDDGVVEGGEWRLGGDERPSRSSASTASVIPAATTDDEGLSMRERMARAAEERARRSRGENDDRR